MMVLFSADSHKSSIYMIVKFFLCFFCFVICIKKPQFWGFVSMWTAIRRYLMKSILFHDVICCIPTPSHTRSSFEHTLKTRERYNQCQNVNCGATFVTHETFTRWINESSLIEFAPPHPTGAGQQTVMSFDEL
jgi:hypothetical protein